MNASSFKLCPRPSACRPSSSVKGFRCYACQKVCRCTCREEAKNVHLTTTPSSLSQASLPSLLINEGKQGRGGNYSNACGRLWPGHTAAGVLRAVLCRDLSHVTAQAAERAGTWTGTETVHRGTLRWRLRPWFHGYRQRP